MLDRQVNNRVQANSYRGKEKLQRVEIDKSIS